MRLARIPFLVAALVAAIMAWQQDHSQHRITPVPADHPIPSISLDFTPDPTGGYNLRIETRNFRFTPENVNTEPVFNEGHAHLYVNRRKVARLYSEWHHLSPSLLKSRYNEVRVELNANDHSVWGAGGEPIHAEVLLDAGVRDRDPIVREQVRYRMSWNRGLAKHEATGSWSLTNDLGFRFHVIAGKLLARSLELITCHSSALQPPLAGLRGFFRPVLAGHSSLFPSESRIANPVEEDLAALEDRWLEPKTVTDPAYCEGHYLIAQSPAGAPALEITGTYRRPGESKEQPFRFICKAPFGQLMKLVGPDGSLPVTPSIVGGVRIHVERSLDSLFRGVDPTENQDETMAMKIVRSVVAETRFVMK
jgi:hypothetical protein